MKKSQIKRTMNKKYKNWKNIEIIYSKVSQNYNLHIFKFNLNICWLILLKDGEVEINIITSDLHTLSYSIGSLYLRWCILNHIILIYVDIYIIKKIISYKPWVLLSSALLSGLSLLLSQEFGYSIQSPEILLYKERRPTLSIYLIRQRC